ATPGPKRVRGGPGAHRHSNSQNLLGGGTAYLKVLALSLEGIGKDAIPCRRFSLHNPRCGDPVGPPFVELEGIVAFAPRVIIVAILVLFGVDPEFETTS